MLRLPSMVYNQQLNPDESQMITQAITLLQNPVYWDSVDGTTIGPINSYLLVWPGLFGWPITYFTTRLTGTVLIGFILLFLFAGLRRVVAPQSARIALVVLVLFFSYVIHFDFLHYSSELASLVLLTLGWYYFIRLQAPSGFSNQRLDGLWAGFALGCVPFAKLQSMPSAALIAVAILASLFFLRPCQHRGINPPVWFILGLALPTGFVVGCCYYFGVLNRFYTFYIQSNLFNYGEYNQYLYPATRLSFWSKTLRLPVFFQSETTFLPFFLFVLLLSAATVWIILIKRQPLLPGKRWIGCWSVAWLGASLYSVVKPGTEFTHHLLLLVPSLGWLGNLVIDQFLSLQTARYPVIFPRLFLLGNLFFFGKTAIQFRQNPVATNYYLYATRNPAHFPNSRVSDVLLHYARPNDRLVVWGWNMTYHVEAQLPQGTSENHSFRSIVPHSLRRAYQEKYMEDITSTQPTLFVDATGPNSLWMTDTTVYRHENFPALASYISKQYHQVAVVDQVRIYLRNDRAMRLQTFLPPNLMH
ncbi:hypothetical protein ACFPMF_01495 [Larkinella bovis]|uniref:Glycosyltransferase RgtA/B/C/D-like domain-containing protein n=1 Tax=Larkinella bovis TaxID=683041 RepID=A0ABW0I3N0_9BACT